MAPDVSACFLPGPVSRRQASPRWSAHEAERAEAIDSLFAAHVARENDVLLPLLLAVEQVDLARLLGQMHRRAEPAGRVGPVGES